MDVPRDLPYAALGAIVTVVAFQVPLAPLVGGAVAAGVRRNPADEGVRVGAIAGIFATILLLALGGATDAALAMLQTRGAVNSLHIGLLGLIVVLYVVVFSALGGFVGGLVRAYLVRRVGSQW